MRVLQFEEFGSPVVILKMIEKEDPEPQPNEIRIKMLYRPINPSDIYYISGNYGIQPKLPAIPGFEGMGVIDKIGNKVKDLVIGERVIPLGIPGTWSEYLIARPDQIIKVPNEMNNKTAAQLLINPITAWILLKYKLKLEKDNWLLQSAAGSTLGRMVMQISKLLGIKTINLVRRREQVEELLELGADIVICTKDKDVIEQIKRITKKGVHGAIDCVGGKTGSLMTSCLRNNADLIIYGLLSGEDIRINTGELIFRETKIRGFWLSRWFDRTPANMVSSILSELIELIIQGKIMPSVEAEYDFLDYKNAIKHSLRSGRHGKVLLKS